MTTRAPYSTNYEPPAPVLPVRVAPPLGGRGVGLLGVVDTGADITIIPESAARSLRLPIVSRVRVVGVTGTGESASVRAASIELAGTRFLIEVACLGDEAIVGRDLLNRMVVRLDGPRRSLEASPHTPPRRAKRRPPKRR